MFARNIWWSKLPQKFWWNKGWIIAQPQSPGCRDAPLTLGAGRPSSAAFWSIERVELAAESVSEGKSLWLAVQLSESLSEKRNGRRKRKARRARRRSTRDFTRLLRLLWIFRVICNFLSDVLLIKSGFIMCGGGKSCFTVTNSIFSTFWFPFLSDDYRLTLHGGMERYFLSCRCRM